jgi:organic radical activating enzyme
MHMLLYYDAMLTGDMIPVKIHNVRAGFATNSSSSHSIVMLAPGTQVRSQEWDRFNYGWEEFTLADPDSKTAYLAIQLKLAMESEGIPDSTCVQLINSWLNTSYEASDLLEGGVDHQSHWGVFHGALGTNPEFVKQYHAWLQRDDVVILGGNDNSDGQTPPDLIFETPQTQLVHRYGKDLRVRQDGVYWILFDPKISGNKIRFSFDATAPNYEKSVTPELADVRLTNYCRWGCEFCYQGSTKSGAHASWQHVNAVLEALSDLDVFEVAFGGGEPTHYPHFAQAIRRAAELNIVPNFTTFGVDWLKNEDLVQAVQRHVSAVGVSVHSVKDLNKVTRIRQVLDQGMGWGERRVHVTPQHVVGSVDMGVTAQLLEESWKQGMDMLLLGYKQVGFGAHVKPHDMTGLDTLLKLQMDRMNKAHYNTRFRSLGVDTAFVQQFQPLLDQLNIPHVLVTNEEGAFSMYVDCVNLQQGPSSYMPDRMVDLDMGNLRDSIAQEYVKW